MIQIYGKPEKQYYGFPSYFHKLLHHNANLNLINLLSIIYLNFWFSVKLKMSTN